eukprot:9479944-Pyramimonas_sp.AAC.1
MQKALGYVAEDKEWQASHAGEGGIEGEGEGDNGMLKDAAVERSRRERTEKQRQERRRGRKGERAGREGEERKRGKERERDRESAP